MPFIKHGKFEFNIRVEPDLYRHLMDIKSTQVPLATFCTMVIEEAVGYRKD